MSVLLTLAQRFKGEYLMKMTNSAIWGSFFILIIVILPIFAQEEDVIREEVSVVNIEVPVRVYLKGNQVENLSREDFELYEGKEQREINGFFVKKKTIKIQDTGQAAAEQSLPSRYFVLAFQIREFNDHLKHGIRYIFENMLHRNDRLMVLALDKTLFFNNLSDKEQALGRVFALLKNQASEARKRFLNLRSKVRNNPIFNSPGNSVSKHPLDSEFELVYDYLKRYEQILLDYKKKHLIPQIAGFYNFANHLDTIDQEKWVISFYQEEVYPHLGPSLKRWINTLIDKLMVEPEHKSTYAQMLHTLLLRVERELSAAAGFPVEDVHKFFTRSDVTFHSLLIPLVAPQSFQFSSGFFQLGFEYKKISTDFENSIRALTKKTGGTLAHSGNLVASLQTIEEMEDTCYWLTYSPKNPQELAKVEVKVRGPGYKTVYDNNLKPDYLRRFIEKREIRLKNVSFDKGKLQFQINGFQLQEKDKKKVGKLSLRVRVTNSNNKDVFDQKKTLLSVKKNINISIPFFWLPSGKYRIIVETTDLFSGKSNSKFLDPVVMENIDELKSEVPVVTAE
jgi:hypothetical protein